MDAPDQDLTAHAPVEQNHKRRTKRNGCIALIGILIPLAIAVVQYGPTWKELIRDHLQDGGPSGRKLSYYIAYLTLEDIPNAGVDQPNVRLTYNISVQMYANDSSKLFYSDRIQASRGIDYAKSSPPLVILNSTQFPDNNRTLLEFRIDPVQSNLKKFEFNGIASMQILLKTEKGKFGPHIPINADLASMTVDFARLTKLQVPKDISARVEGRNQQGGLQYNIRPVVTNNWMKDNGTFSVVATDLPDDSSIVLVWGD